MFLTESYSAFIGKKPRRQRAAGKAVQYLRIRIRESRSSCRSDTIAAIFCGIQPKKAIRAMITAIQKKLSPPPNTRWKREERPLPCPAEAILKLISYSLLSCAAGKNPEPTPAICLYRCRQHHRTAKRRTRQSSASRGLYLQRYFNTAVSQLFEIHIVIGDRYYLSDKPRFLLLIRADFIRGEAFKDREQLRIVY